MAEYNFPSFPSIKSIKREWALRAARRGLAKVMRKSYSDQETKQAALEMIPKVMGFIEKHVGSLKNKRILEVGCGIGRFTQELAKKAEHVTAVDMTPNMLVQAQKNLNKFKNIQFIQSEIKDLDFGENEFDLVFDVWVLMHILHRRSYHKSIQKMKKFGKYVFICEYTAQGKPVGRYSIIRSREEYMRDFKPLVLRAEDKFYYVKDESSLLLFKKV